MCAFESRYWHAFLNAKIKLERSPRLIACHKGNILKLALVICDLSQSQRLDSTLYKLGQWSVEYRVSLLAYMLSGITAHTTESSVSPSNSLPMMQSRSAFESDTHTVLFKQLTGIGSPGV